MREILKKGAIHLAADEWNIFYNISAEMIRTNEKIFPKTNYSHWDNVYICPQKK